MSCDYMDISILNSGINSVKPAEIKNQNENQEIDPTKEAELLEDLPEEPSKESEKLPMNPRMENILMSNNQNKKHDLMVRKSFKCYLRPNGDLTNIVFVTMNRNLNGKVLYKCLCPGAVCVLENKYFLVLRISCPDNQRKSLICKGIEVDIDDNIIGKKFIYEDISNFTQPFDWFFRSEQLLTVVKKFQNTLENDDSLMELELSPEKEIQLVEHEEILKVEKKI